MESTVSSVDNSLCWPPEFVHLKSWQHSTSVIVFRQQQAIIKSSDSWLSNTLRDDKVSVLAHTYPHKPLRKNKVTMCNHQADSPFYVLHDVWSVDLQV